MKGKNIILALTRIVFAAVFAINVLCALQFIIAPGDYVSAYQLSGAGLAGDAAIQGYGVVFLMWNATYPLFVWDPRRFKVLGGIIIAQQLIGCLGETMILLSFPEAGFEVLAGSIARFIAFDAGGLVLMLAAYLFMLHVLRRDAERAEEPASDA